MTLHELRANIEDIETAYREGLNANDKPSDTAKRIIAVLGTEDAAHYVAALVRVSAWDGRISHAAKAWAESVALPEDMTARIDNIWSDVIHKAHLSQIAEAMPDALEAAQTEEAAEEETLVCVYCGCMLDLENVWHDTDGKLCCEDCFDERYTYCERCGDVIDRDDGVWVQDAEEYVCEDCADRYYYRCSDCGAYFTRDGIALIDNNSDECICTDCESCYDWAQCDDCGSIQHTWNMEWNDDDGCYYCDDCAPEHRACGALNDYGYKPDPWFLRAPDDAPGVRFYGVELEIDDGDDAESCAEDLTDLTDAIYCKHDGSLGDEGVEIVTHPATLAYHLITMPWADIVSAARDHDYTSHDAGTCGLHIHVGRAEMPDDAPEKLVALVDSIWGALVTFSRRDVSALRRWAAKPDAGITADDDPASGKDKMDKARARGRYQAVNLQNSATIEFRMFRGSLVLETIRATIQCVDLLCEYAATHSLKECAGATWADIRETGADMEDFCAYCEKRGI